MKPILKVPYNYGVILNNKYPIYYNTNTKRILDVKVTSSNIKGKIHSHILLLDERPYAKETCGLCGPGKILKAQERLKNNVL